MDSVFGCCLALHVNMLLRCQACKREPIHCEYARAWCMGKPQATNCQSLCFFQLVTCMQGRCSSLPDETLTDKITGAPLLQLPSTMCLILADADVFPVSRGNLWLDNLYVRATTDASVAGPRDPAVEMMLVREQGQVWMSNVIMQGTGNDSNVAMDVLSHINAEGAHVRC